MKLVLAHKKKLLVGAAAAAYAGLGWFTGDMTMVEAFTKFLTIVGLGAM